MKFSLILLSVLGSLAACHADSVRLQIKGLDGKPVAGAKVRVLETRLEPVQIPSSVTTDLKSDAAGVVTITSKAPLQKTGEAFGRSLLQARVIAPGLAVALVNLKAGSNSVTLQKAQSFGGVILDADDKPLAGIKVFLTQIDSPLRENQMVYSSEGYLGDKLRLETRSDAQGRWKLENIALKGNASFSFNDMRFKSEFLRLDVSRPAPPLYLELGAVVKGRLLRPDGKPAAGVELYGTGSPRTKADGSFQIGGLGGSRTYLLAINSQSAPLPFIVPQKRIENLESGEVRDIGDWKTVKGLHLRGKLVDVATGKPIERAWISSWGGDNSASGQTDSAGRFDFLIGLKNTSFSVSSSDFLAPRQPKIKPTAAQLRSGVIDIGTLKLKSAHKVSGTVKTVTGEGIGASIQAVGTKGKRAYAESDRQGKFTLSGLDEGEYRVAVSGHKLKTPQKLVVGKGPLAPLRLVLIDSIKAKAATPRLVTGRALFNGVPVAGVKVKFDFRAERNWYSGLTTISDLNGVYAITSPIPDSTPMITGVSRPGYDAEYGEPTIQDGTWHADLTLQKRGTLRGRVVDAAGNAVAHAFVASEKSAGLPIETDGAGQFALKDVPMPGGLVFVSDGARNQSYKTDKEGEGIQIVLPEAAPIADKAALADKALPGSRLDWEWGQQWQNFNNEPFAETLVRARADGDTYWFWKSALHTLAQRAPSKFIAQEKEIRERASNANAAEFERMLMLARACSKDPATRAQAASWLSTQEKERREISPSSVSQLLGIAEVAQKLDPAQGAMWSDYAAQLADQISANEEYRWTWGGLAARISPSAVETLSEECSTSQKLQYLSVAMNAYVESGNAPGARQILAKMSRIAQQLEKEHKAKTKKGRPSRELQRARSTLAQARHQLVRALVPNEPDAALAATQKLQPYYRRTTLLLIAQSADKRGKTDVVRKILGLLAKEQLQDPDFNAQLATLALRFDPALAERLFRDALRQSNPKNRESDPWRYYMDSNPEYTSRFSIAGFAKARAAKWPGESRILIEREWLQRQGLAKKPLRYTYTNSQNMKNLVAAMAEIDPVRALEMANQMPETYRLAAQARAEVAIALLRSR